MYRFSPIFYGIVAQLKSGKKGIGMNKDANCGYCMEGDLLGGFGIKVCDLDSSMVILFKEQSHKGRVIVAYKEHISDITLLSDDDRNAFFADVTKVAKAIQNIFNPDKINYGAFGDTSGHLHFHLVPKYKEQFEWTSTFAMNPNKEFLTEDEYKKIVGLIRKAL